MEKEKASALGGKNCLEETPTLDQNLVNTESRKENYNSDVSHKLHERQRRSLFLAIAPREDIMLCSEQLASSTVGCSRDPKLHPFHGLSNGERSVDSSLHQDANPSDAVEHVSFEFGVCWPL